MIADSMMRFLSRISCIRPVLCPPTGRLRAQIAYLRADTAVSMHSLDLNRHLTCTNCCARPVLFG